MFALFKGFLSSGSRNLAISNVSKVTAGTPCTQQLREMSKLKTHTGAAKRWKRVGSGLFKRKQCGKRHLNSSMTPSRRRALNKTVLSNPTQTKILKKIMPY
ncbi:hypothetical protein BB560_005629 [Smittium megazygosporum]|uniref:50S ribosomal protein L35 n=1 Tax=Smittium megazygosporum TaxID=133381 RepID=A0A2T9Z228_9FUNG|nr:hypothetical protein BB560_005629 [Smittium megazygosporum]